MKPLPFVVKASPIFADSFPIDAGWVLAAFVGSGSIIALLFKTLLASKEAQIKDRDDQLAKFIAARDIQSAQEESFKKSWQEIAFEAIKSSHDAANEMRSKKGKDPVPLVTPVLPESHSPSNPAQRETAAIATARAALAAIKLSIDQEPRPQPPRDDGSTEPPLNPIGFTAGTEVHQLADIRHAAGQLVDTTEKIVDSTAKLDEAATLIDKAKAKLEGRADSEGDINLDGGIV